MTEHLPECHQPKYLNQVMWGSISRDEPFVPCICDALRTCEARVHEAAYQAGKAYGLTVNGYTRGLDAAREAVAALSKFAEANCNDGGDWRVGRADGLRDALDAIDALTKGEQP